MQNSGNYNNGGYKMKTREKYKQMLQELNLSQINIDINEENIDACGLDDSAMHLLFENDVCYFVAYYDRGGNFLNIIYKEDLSKSMIIELTDVIS
jgi:hypothetical protein